MPKLNWKRLYTMAGLLLLLILLIRGCVFACRSTPEKIATDTPDNKPEINLTTVRLYLHREKRTETVNLEEYLIGVVAAEMPASFNVEALKAQAVAARTYALKRLKEGGCSSGQDVCSNSECCQAYRTNEQLKENWGSGYEEKIEKIRRAVNETAKEALYYNGELIEALYHSSSGGMTEDSENVFAAERAYLRSVESPYEIGTSNITDEVVFTKSAFTKAVNKAWPKAKLTASKLSSQVEIKETYSSGRVKALRLRNITVTGREFRGALELRSAWFTINIEGDKVIIKTRGYGHGVGMSQTGANGMAEQGKTYIEILKHYYNGVDIK